MENPFLLIPKEILVSLQDMYTIISFCSSSKHLFVMKEWITKEIITSLLHEEQLLLFESTFIKTYSYYQFLTLLNSKKYFHMVAQHDIWVHFDLCDIFGITHFNSYLTRETGFRETLGFHVDLPGITLHDKRMMDDLFDFCWTKDERTIEYARSVLTKENAANVLIPLVMRNWLVFPEIKKIREYLWAKFLYEPFFDIVFNNKLICAYFMIRLVIQKIIGKRGINTHRFLYFACFFAKSSDMVTKMLMEFKIDIMYKNEILKMK